jgi:hypothetical protein
MKTSAILCALSLASADLYCPTESDMNNEAPKVCAVIHQTVPNSVVCPDTRNWFCQRSQGNITFVDGGWAIYGDGRVSSKTSWNLLGGFMEFDMDTSKV